MSARVIFSFAVLMVLLIGEGALVVGYHVTATAPGVPECQSLISQLVAAVIGRGPFYYVTLSSVVAVLCLSANTSFADFPRLCRVVAEHQFLPEAFAHASVFIASRDAVDQCMLACLACTARAAERALPTLDSVPHNPAATVRANGGKHVNRVRSLKTRPSALRRFGLADCRRGCPVRIDDC